MNRKTPWRQGHVLLLQDAVTLGLVQEGDCNSKVIVITHDCDLDNLSESHLEVLIGRVISTSDGNFIHAKNPRRLHLEFGTQGNKLLDIRHSEKQSIPWERFASIESADPEYQLDQLGRNVFRRWLAARYGRPSFPSNFEDRLRTCKRNKDSLEKLFGALIKSEAMYLVGVYFSLGEDRDADLSDGEPYELSIILLYDFSKHGKDAKNAAERLVPKIQALFRGICGEPGASSTINLDSCIVQSDVDFSVADLRRFDQWRLEYVSLGSDDAGDSLSAGEGI